MELRYTADWTACPDTELLAGEHVADPSFQPLIRYLCGDVAHPTPGRVHQANLCDI